MSPIPQNKIDFENLLKKSDFEGLARAFQEGDLEWHEKEWKEFIEMIRQQEREEIWRITHPNTPIGE